MPLTWVEINQSHLRHNLAQFKKITKSVELWPVIKSNAYGHGLEIVTQILDQDTNATGFMVANLSEALLLRSLSPKPIMVLSYFELAEIDLTSFDSHKISLPIYDMTTANLLNDLAKKNNKKFLVNIKIDTGTSRLGFRAEEAGEAISQIKVMTNLEIFSVFTHFAESEAEDKSFTEEQLDILLTIKKDWPEFKYHAACSAAALSADANHLDIIRLGLALYGLWPSPAAAQRGLALGLELRPVLSWRTKIIQIKNIKKGETIGYDRTFRADHDMSLAVLPVGYYEGYDRGLSNKSQVIITGHLCPLRGNICMNLMMVELPRDMQVELGQAVVLLGQDGKQEVTADTLAQWAQTINYEILARINPQLARQVV